MNQEGPIDRMEDKIIWWSIDRRDRQSNRARRITSVFLVLLFFTGGVCLFMTFARLLGFNDLLIGILPGWGFWPYLGIGALCIEIHYLLMNLYDKPAHHYN